MDFKCAWYGARGNYAHKTIRILAHEFFEIFELAYESRLPIDIRQIFNRRYEPKIGRIVAFTQSIIDGRLMLLSAIIGCMNWAGGLNIVLCRN